MDKQKTTKEEREKLIEDVIGTLSNELNIDEVLIKEHGKE